jgi:hypothetical protein
MSAVGDSAEFFVNISYVSNDADAQTFSNIFPSMKKIETGPHRK